MNKKTTRILFLGSMAAFMIMVPMVLIFNQTLMHEAVHQIIGAEFGNCSSNVTWSVSGAYIIATTHYSNCNFTNQQDYDYARILNTENEIIGYSIGPLMNAVILCTMMVCIIVAISAGLISLTIIACFKKAVPAKPTEGEREGAAASLKRPESDRPPQAAPKCKGGRWL